MMKPDFKAIAEYINDQKGKVFSGSIQESRIAEIEYALKQAWEQGYKLGNQKKYLSIQNQVSEEYWENRYER